MLTAARSYRGSPSRTRLLKASGYDQLNRSSAASARRSQHPSCPWGCGCMCEVGAMKHPYGAPQCHQTLGRIKRPLALQKHRTLPEHGLQAHTLTVQPKAFVVQHAQCQQAPKAMSHRLPHTTRVTKQIKTTGKASNKIFAGSRSHFINANPCPRHSLGLIGPTSKNLPNR